MFMCLIQLFEACPLLSDDMVGPGGRGSSGGGGKGGGVAGDTE